MSRPTSYDFTQPSKFKIYRVLNYIIVGLDKSGNIHEDITKPDYEAWFLFRLSMAEYTGQARHQQSTIILTNGDEWYKIAAVAGALGGAWWQVGPNENFLSKLKLMGVNDQYAEINSYINLHQNDKAAINAIIKDAMQKEKYSL